MDPKDRLGLLYYMLAAISLVFGWWMGHALTLRSWVSWWGDVGPFLRETVRKVVREELDRREEDK